MKFHFFHLMPYPALPDDFRERYRSVWVDPPASELYDPVIGHHAYNDYLDELEYAAELGFDGICVNEHHSNGYGLMPSPNLMAATLARRTTSAKIVVLGNSVALYNPPIRVAEEMAMLDVISGGRLVAGFPVGSPMDTAYAYGENPATLREKYYEGVKLILRAWKSDAPFTFNGKYTQLRYVNVWPRTLQRPHPPVWIPGGGSIETWGWCAENNFLYAYLSYFGYEMAKKTMNAFWEDLDERGIERNPYRAGFLQFVGVADSDAEAERLYKEPALYFWNKAFKIYPGFATPPGYTTPATIRKGLDSMVAVAADRGTKEVTWEEILERGYIVVGSVDTVVDRLNDLADTLNVGHLMLLLHFGDMSKDLTMYNTERFVRGVIPRLRHRFDEFEDHWWPSDDTLIEPARPPVGAAG